MEYPSPICVQQAGSEAGLKLHVMFFGILHVILHVILYVTLVPMVCERS
jgi:hypothetical protein